MELKIPHKDWLDGRGIDPSLAEKFGLHTVLMHGKNWLAVPYVEHGRTVNHKYRVTSDKSAQMMDQGAPLTLLNHDCLLDDSLASTPLIIVEGEWDLLVTMSAGKRRVVSVPNGAPKGTSDDQELTEGARYAWYWRHEALLSQVKQVILAVDNDEPGKALAADLCRLFGPERCLFVEYPDLCKDPNDVVRLYSHQRLIEMLDAAKPYPVKGLYEVDDFPEQPAYTKYGTGIIELDELFQIVLRTFTVVTGYAGQGKTSFLMWILAGLIKRGVHVTVASFETDIKPIFIRKLRAAILGAGEYAQHDPEQLKWADMMIRKHLAIISHSPNDDDEALGIEDVLDLGRASVVRNGTRLLLIDPWNEIDHKRGRDESETDYTGRAIRMIKRFAKQNDVAVWVIAHPSKPAPGFGKAKLPGLYDISGSANWANKADYGLVFQIKSRDYWTSTIACTKVRMGLPGRMGQIVVQFDPRKSSYSFYHGDDFEDAA
ncbi:MAG TPA: AAA family ATPase [Sphingobium sp.]|uniref:AAA family ATPase n=1 Tax=Sphingobium sp. TaxID=1912891 RepID=UPI002ED21455